MADQERMRENWTEMDPDLRKYLSQFAFSSSGENLTPEMRNNLQDNFLQDIIDEEQGAQ